MVHHTESSVLLIGKCPLRTRTHMSRSAPIFSTDDVGLGGSIRHYDFTVRRRVHRTAGRLGVSSRLSYQTRRPTLVWIRLRARPRLNALERLVRLVVRRSRLLLDVQALACGVRCGSH